MKIDIHAHTKKTKSGDSELRNIDAEKFKEIIKMTDVKILAITNHNHFDLDQYRLFAKSTNGLCQIWPGIELDIFENGRHGHLLVIVNPKNSEEFSRRIEELLKGKTEDTFTINLINTVTNFDSIDAIYIPHYYIKKPDLLNEDIDFLLNSVSNYKRVIKEATNSLSAGIYVSHGHRSIYGSDVQNWDEYTSIAKDLPDLRLPVESYEQFCLLLEKDDTTINTILNKKMKENIVLNPFGLAELIELNIYNDINILFGSKGTGKTEILKALSRFYNGKGHKTEVYESSAVQLDSVYDLKGIDFNINLEDQGITECSDEIQFIKNVTEKSITSISKYHRYFAEVETNKISQSLKIKNFTSLDESFSERRFTEIQETLDIVERFQIYINSGNTLQDVIDKELLQEMISVINKVKLKIRTESEKRFIDSKTISLFNNFIRIFIAEISKKTGRPEKPVKTGFHDYASNRITIERNINKIVNNISKEIEPIIDYVGNLGEKGELYCQTNLVIQTGSLTDGKYSPIRKVNKLPQKEVSRQLNKISKYIYSNDLFEKISELNNIEDSEKLNCLSDLLLFFRHFILNGKEYHPSNGESSMVLLHKELIRDREIYLIDEPERSLGNDYINDVILPLLKEHERRGKTVIIATHDANIAVRTLPYNSIYREHDINGYNTFVGNPFSNNLICVNNKEKGNLDWKNISMKTLEGGKEAFGERGKIYGTI